MLVLAREKNEKVLITTPTGERIEVVVVDIQSDKVKLGFEADREVVIHREEVQRQVDAAALLEKGETDD